MFPEKYYSWSEKYFFNFQKWNKKLFLGVATQKIRQSVKNSSQRKREFLRQIQEEENITRNNGSPNYEEKTASSYDELEGQVKSNNLNS